MLSAQLLAAALMAAPTGSVGASPPTTEVALAVPAPVSRRRRARRRRPRLGYGLGYGLGTDPGAWKQHFLKDPFADLLEELEAEEDGLVLSGLLSVGLVAAGDGRGTSGLPPATRYVGQTLFTLPQASVSLDAGVGERVDVHVQLDFSTDTASALPQSVGLNEAYALVRDVPRGLSLRVGGFSPPLASWEVNGPFLTLNDTITHSVVNTPFEAGRVVGVELTNAFHIEPGELRFSLGLFGGGDTTPTGGHVRAFGQVHEGLGLGSLSNMVSFDDEPGWFLDVEAPPARARRVGWRASWMDVGGDLGAPRPSREQDLWQLGAWVRRRDWRVQTQVSEVRTRDGAGPLAETDSRAGYLLVNRAFGENASATVRFGRFENESAGARDRGRVWTVAWNRHLSRTSMIQFEYLDVDHLPEPAAGRADVDDDMVQARFMVWF